MGLYIFLINTLILPINLLQIIVPMGAPDPGGDPGIPITEGLVVLISSAISLGIRTFSKKRK